MATTEDRLNALEKAHAVFEVKFDHVVQAIDKMATKIDDVHDQMTSVRAVGKAAHYASGPVISLMRPAVWGILGFIAAVFGYPHLTR